MHVSRWAAVVDGNEATLEWEEEMMTRLGWPVKKKRLEL
jgi:hypothetical protein